MKKLISINKKGFTIIEVVLVLAIAGLIFLMVFVALPALQIAQRDSHRKRNIQIVSSALENYKSNNRGMYPWMKKTATANDRFLRFTNQERQDFFNSYVNPDGNIFDPSGGEYEFVLLAFNLAYNPTLDGGSASGFPRSRSFIYVTGGAVCERTGFDNDAATKPSSYTIQYRLEIGGIQCQQFN